MKIKIIIVHLLVLSIGLLWQAAEVKAGDQIAVTILSPKDGEIVKPGPVEIHYTFDRGTKGDHVHFYVDGKFTKSSKKESGTLWDLPPGKHLIELRGATREANEEHKEMGNNSRITVYLPIPGAMTAGSGVKAQR